MDIFDQILEHLELERELGTRTVEIDRALLVPPKPSPPPAAIPIPKPRPVSAETASAERSVGAEASSARQERASPSVVCDILFVSGRPLSAAGVEAIRKTIVAMNKIKADLDVRLNEEVRAKVVILLGSDALKKLQPNAGRPVRGRWLTANGVPALPTFSPDYIFSHFQEGSPGRKEATRDMWNDVKAAIARL